MAVAGAGAQAASRQAAVSKALVIFGMFIPKFGLKPFFETVTFGGVLTVVLPSCWAVSAARSHDPISWERATEKNRNT